ncbi:MAG: hemolysin family protein [Candidatus Krumholzibacteria bacterium]|nr:hemolysin family protein [Candidatus Krumholzibacteria bacterium]
MEALGSHLPLIVLLAVLLSFSSFFSASETAFFSISRSAAVEMEHGGRRERLAARILRDPRMLLVTILFGNLLVNIYATSAVTALAIELYGDKGVGIAVAVMTVLILFIGEISPKSLALKRSSSFAALAAPLLWVLMIVFAPVRILLGAIADYTVEKSRKVLGDSRETYGASELAAAVEIGHRDGLFGEFEKEVLTNLFLFTEITAREIQTPRLDVFALDVDTPLNQAIAQVKARGFSRVPLFSGTGDTIVGILYSKDLLRFSRDDRIGLADIYRPAVFVPESKKIRDLFGELIASHQHLVVVVDEHGTYTGILALEDILEEIFGEIRNRREPRVEEYHRLDENRIVADGTMNLRDVNDILGTRLESSDVETIAGYLVEKIGRIPREGESFALDGLRLLVLSATRVRVNKLKLERLPEEGGQ